jgi:hypothetical protein
LTFWQGSKGLCFSPQFSHESFRIAIDEFEQIDVSRGYTDIKRKILYQRLIDDYHVHLAEYRSYLGKGKVTIEKKDIPLYVRHRQDSFVHLAVKEVEIYCSFKRNDVERLGLIDIPGLGDTRLGDDKLIVQTLAKDADLVLFLRRPDSRGDQWQKEDVDLYGLADEALSYLSSRSFMILNHIDSPDTSNNYEMCLSMQDTNKSIKTAGSFIRDCSKAAACHEILDRVLLYLEQNIELLERKYAQSCQDRLLKLHHKIDELLETSRKKIKPSNDRELQIKKQEELIEDITEKLSDLVSELREQKNKPDDEFKSIVENVLTDCKNDTGLPTIVQIDSRYSGEGKKSYKASYCLYVSELKTHLSRKFQNLNNGLGETSIELKTKIAEVFSQSKLRNLFQSTGAEVLGEMAELLDNYSSSSSSSSSSPLASCFRDLEEFKISYSELMLKDIQKELEDILDPDGLIHNQELAEASSHAIQSVVKIAAVLAEQTKDNLPLGQDLNQAQQAVEQLVAIAEASSFITELNAKKVLENLKSLHKKAIDGCDGKLSNWLAEPNKIRYSKAQDFVEQILYAGSRRTQWDIFLSDPEVCPIVWEEFHSRKKVKELREKLLQAVERISVGNQREKMKWMQ